MCFKGWPEGGGRKPQFTWLEHPWGPMLAGQLAPAPSLPRHPLAHASYPPPLHTRILRTSHPSWGGNLKGIVDEVLVPMQLKQVLASSQRYSLAMRIQQWLAKRSPSIPHPQHLEATGLNASNSGTFIYFSQLSHWKTRNWTDRALSGLARVWLDWSVWFCSFSWIGIWSKGRKVQAHINLPWWIKFPSVSIFKTRFLFHRLCF